MIFRTILLCLICVEVQALPITIEPDDYQPGSVLPQDQGARIRFFSHGTDGAPAFAYSDAVVTDCSNPAGLDCHAVTGSNALGHHTGGLENFFPASGYFPIAPADISRLSDFSALLIEFDSPIDSFSAQLNSNSGDSVEFVAFASDGRLISRGDGPRTHRDWNGPGLIGDWVYDISVESFAFPISTIVLGSRSAAAYVDSITFNRIPEPSSLVLLAVGLLGLLSKRRSA